MSISTAKVECIVEHLPGPPVVHLATEHGSMTIELRCRADKKLFQPGQEYYFQPKGARTEEEEHQQLMNVLTHFAEAERLEKLSDAALVRDVLKRDAADDQAVVELMNRVHPGWEQEDPPPAKGPTYWKERSEKLSQHLNRLIEASEAVYRRLKVTEELYNDQVGENQLPDGVTGMVVTDYNTTHDDAVSYLAHGIANVEPQPA